MHRKGAQDAKRAKIFTKIIREITVAVQLGGGDAESNPRLRTALLAARSANMPKDNVDRAIKKGLGETDGASYSEMRYEGYGPGGTAFLVEALSDNKNRTAAEVRACFSKHGGNMGESGSVSFMFKHHGLIVYPLSIDEEKLLDAALEGGAENFDRTDDGFMIDVSRSEWLALREALEQEFGPALHAAIEWTPETTIDPGDKVQSVEKLMQALEENDDVQAVWHNAKISSN